MKGGQTGANSFSATPVLLGSNSRPDINSASIRVNSITRDFFGPSDKRGGGGGGGAEKELASTNLGQTF